MQDTVPFAATDVLLQVTDTLLQAILSSTSTTGTTTTTSSSMIDTTSTTMSAVPDSSALLSWDRIDSLANTLISYIALDTNRFTTSAQYLVQQQLPSVQPTLLQALTRLSTARGVNLQAIDKANRQKFVLNFREFVTQIKSLSLS